MTATAKRHHVVPRFYLERFSKDGQITVVRHGGKPYTTNVINAGVEGRFNTINGPDGEPSLFVEDMFAEIEAKAKPVLEEIVATGRVPFNQPRSIVAYYMALQYVRTPEWRDLADISAEIHQKTRMLAHTDDSVHRMYRAMEGRYATADELAAVRYVQEHIDGIVVNESNNDYFRSALRMASDDIMPRLFYQMHWYLITAPKAGFITSDHPIVFPSAPGYPVGIGTAPEIFFPIDSAHVLVLLAEAFPLTGRHALNPDAVRMMNQLVADKSYEWVACHPDQTDALDGLEMPDDPPLLSVNGAMVHGDRRGINDAVEVMRQMGEAAKRAAAWRAANTNTNTNTDT